MVLYNCECCNFVSKLKGNYNKHLKTKKHLNNQAEGELSSKIDEVEKEYEGTKNIQKHPKTSNKHPKTSNKHPINIQKESEISEYEFGIYNCNYCDRGFTNLSNMRRHELHRCKKRINLESIYKKEMKEFKKEKEQLYKQIDALIKKAGNTTITNNLNLNSYGKEDLSHITDSFKTNLIKGPFRMIPKMIEAVHFNDKKPENKNISLTNKKENVIKVFKGGKWKYYNKNDIMEELMETNYYLLDSHYEIDHELNGVQKARYSKFQEKYDTGELSKDTKDCINLLLLNGAE